jgi:hypothetical protein
MQHHLNKQVHAAPKASGRVRCEDQQQLPKAAILQLPDIQQLQLHMLVASREHNSPPTA